MKSPLYNDSLITDVNLGYGPSSGGTPVALVLQEPLSSSATNIKVHLANKTVDATSTSVPPVIIFTTPVFRPGIVNVYASYDIASTTAFTNVVAFEYINKQKTITTVSPSSGSSEGGFPVILALNEGLGYDFKNIKVHIGNLIIEPDLINTIGDAVAYTAPRNEPGTSNVFITYDAGTSINNSTHVAQFEYLCTQKNITSISPDNGSTSGGYQVTISLNEPICLGFTNVKIHVNKDQELVQINPDSISGTSIIYTAPAISAGTADAYITYNIPNSLKQESSHTNFTYN